jgi:hypothetical protein
MRAALCCVLVVLCLGATTVASEQGRVVQLGQGHSYQWSPDGLRLGLMKRGEFCLYDVTKDTLSRVGELPSRAYTWLNDSQIICVTYPKLQSERDSLTTVARSYYTISKSLDSLLLDSSYSNTYSAQDGPQFFTDGKGTAYLHWKSRTESAEVLATSKAVGEQTAPPYIGVISHCPAVRTSHGPLYPDTDIWLINRHGVVSRRVTQAKEYILPKLSPNGLLVTAYDYAGHVLILDTLGQEQGRFAGGGDNSWSYDSRSVYFSQIEESEWDIVAGDLFKYSLADGSIEQVTHSPDRPELEPRVSPDGRMLAYSAYEEGTKRIEVLFLMGR